MKKIKIILLILITILFSCKEKDKETTVGEGSYDFGARIYDSRLGRWLTSIPLFSNQMTTFF